MTLFKKAKKWLAQESTRDASLSLMSVILANSKIDFFAQNVDSFINIDLCPKGKMKPYAYPCILRFLRGRYYQDTLENYQQDSGADLIGKHYSFEMRPKNEQSSGPINNRIHLLAELMFFKSKAEFSSRDREIAVAIVVQFVAHRQDHSLI